jgi:hypothetical protein
VSDGWIITLMILGGALEFAGIVTVVADIRSTRRAVEEFTHAPQTVYVGSALRMSGTVHVAKASGGKRRSLETRVGLLKQGIANLREHIDNQMRELPPRWRHEISKSARRTEMWAK